MNFKVITKEYKQNSKLPKKELQKLELYFIDEILSNIKYDKFNNEILNLNDIKLKLDVEYLSKYLKIKIEHSPATKNYYVTGDVESLLLDMDIISNKSRVSTNFSIWKHVIKMTDSDLKTFSFDDLCNKHGFIHQKCYYVDIKDSIIKNSPIILTDGAFPEFVSKVRRLGMIENYFFKQFVYTNNQKNIKTIKYKNTNTLLGSLFKNWSTIAFVDYDIISTKQSLMLSEIDSFYFEIVNKIVPLIENELKSTMITLTESELLNIIENNNA